MKHSCQQVSTKENTNPPISPFGKGGLKGDLQVKKKLIVILIIFISLYGDVKFCVSTQASEINIHGFALGSYTSRSNSKNEIRDLILGEEKLRLDISSYSQANDASFQTKIDFIHDGTINENRLDVREIYVDSISKNYNIRFGKQVITWGLGDLLFINDIFPKDWNAFYSGQDMEYLKLGAEAFKFSLYPNFASMELVIMPTFKNDNLLSKEKFIFSDPFADIKNQTIQNPDKKIKDIEAGLRIYRQAGAGDISFYFYKGFYRMPGVKTYNSTAVDYFYPELNVYGASYQLNGLGGVISFEAGYYDSPDDKKGSDPFIDNSKYKYLLGYARQITENLHLGTQYYSEIMRDYQKYKDNLPSGFPQDKENKQIVTLRLTQFLKYETWKLSLFTFYGIDEKDYMLIPEMSYKISDELTLAAGGNIIDGDKDYTTFGRFKENDNVYMRMKYEF